jgi:hypothetical protein
MSVGLAARPSAGLLDTVGATEEGGTFEDLDR